MSFATVASFIEVRNPSICISLVNKATSEELYSWSEILFYKAIYCKPNSLVLVLKKVIKRLKTAFSVTCNWCHRSKKRKNLYCQPLILWFCFQNKVFKRVGSIGQSRKSCPAKKELSSKRSSSFGFKIKLTLMRKFCHSLDREEMSYDIYGYIECRLQKEKKVNSITLEVNLVLTTGLKT